MRSPVGLGLICALLFDHGCARPGLGDDALDVVEEDGGAGQHDGKLPADGDDDDGDDDDDDADDDVVVEDAGRRDAGQDGGRRDAAADTGAPEDDGGSEDAGCTGDSCPEPGSECDAEALPGQLQVGGASVRAIRIDGTTGTFANVSSGASVRVQFEVTFSNCNLIPMPRPVYVGLESTTPECQPALCSSIGAPPNLDFAVIAPSDPGLHYISIGIEEGGLAGLFCASNGSNGSASTRLAALCVTP